MARVLPEPWTEDQISKVKALLTSFVNDQESICAYMDCKKEDLNYLCRKAFGPNVTFAKAVKKYELVGKADLQMALMRAAKSEKPVPKALDFATREYLEILGPVERRRKVAKEVKAEEESTDF